MTGLSQHTSPSLERSTGLSCLWSRYIRSGHRHKLDFSAIETAMCSPEALYPRTRSYLPCGEGLLTVADIDAIPHDSAWKTVSNPPAVDVHASATNPAFSLSIATCPPTLLPLFRRWQRCVPLVQKLSTEQAHDVARLLCDLEPQTSPVSTLMVKLAADIEALALQISQRRTFLERYSQDLEMALHREMPIYQQQPYAVPASHIVDPHGHVPAAANTYPHPAATAAPPLPARPGTYHAAVVEALRPETPHIPETRNEDMIAIRETLYAVLADVLSQSSTLGKTLMEDPARG